MVLKALFSTFLKLKPSKISNNIFRKQGQDLCPFKINTQHQFATTIVDKEILHGSSTTTTTAGFNQTKARIILSLNFKTTDDSLPFLKLPVRQLSKIQKVTNNDEKRHYCQNRLYYIASKINCPPELLSKQIAKRTFVYDLSFDWLEKSLDTLLEMGVTGDRILRDLWVLKYNHMTIRERLQQIKDIGLDTLYPWMVRCSPEILQRYISLTQETKNILGESRSLQIYLSNRLNVSVDEVEDMWVKMPALRTIRVTKIKKFLDFLLDEGFTVDEIAKRPRVLASSQKTIKYRLDKLRNLGLNDINLNSLCRSRKNFQKYYESLVAILNDDMNNEDISRFLALLMLALLFTLDLKTPSLYWCGKTDKTSKFQSLPVLMIKVEGEGETMCSAQWNIYKVIALEVKKIKYLPNRCTILKMNTPPQWLRSHPKV